MRRLSLIRWPAAMQAIDGSSGSEWSWIAFALYAAVGWAVCNAAAGSERAEQLVNLREHRFAFVPPASLDDWTNRAESVRTRVQVAAGLWPMPDRPTPQATVHGKIVRGGYTVEKVYFESYPGLFVTGNLYRPTEGSAPYPAVLSPHGHWGGGRFHRWDDEDFAQQVELGAEPATEVGRYPLQARCVQLARMGCVVFIYDMLGYADSTQLSLLAIHAPTAETILRDPNGWGFYSVQAELRKQGPLGVQTYNSLCALDFLASLDDVDPERLAVTGGSSGGTQTLMVCAVDDRPKVAFPVVMVSTAMQGGCPCENACCLRLGGTSNVEFAALFAPKPLGIASADDWTRGFAEDGFPELQALYRLFDARNQLAHASLIQYPHNYNQASREAMYRWMAQWLGLGTNVSLEERDFDPLSEPEMSVWDEEHPRPSEGREQEVALMQAMDQQSQDLLQSLVPHDAESLQEAEHVLSDAWSILLNRQTIDAEAVSLTPADHDEKAGSSRTKLQLRPSSHGPQLAALLLKPENPRAAVLWLHPQGLRGLLGTDGNPRSEIQQLLDQSIAVMGVDLLEQPQPMDFEAPTVAGMRPAASLTYGYNPTIVARRLADATTAIVALRKVLPDVPVGVVGEPGTASYTAALAALEGERLDALVLDTDGFRFADLESWKDPHFVPGAVKYADLPGLLSLYSPRPLLLLNDQAEDSSFLQAAYQAAGKQQAVVLQPEGKDLQQALQWLQQTLIQ